MGLFDRVKIDARFAMKIARRELKIIDQVLGLDQIWDRDFQTKDLECWMQDYTIDKSGKLWIYADDNDKRKRKRVMHNGDVELYTIITNDDTTFDVDITLNILFTKGVAKVIKSSVDKQSNSTRLKNKKLFEDNRKKYDALRSTSRYRLYQLLYRQPVRLFLRMIRKLGQLVVRFADKTERVLLFW